MSDHLAVQVLSDKIAKVLTQWPTNSAGGKIRLHLIHGEDVRSRSTLGFLKKLETTGYIALRDLSLHQLPQPLCISESQFKLTADSRIYTCPVAFIDAPELSSKSQVIDQMADILTTAKLLTKAAKIVAAPDSMVH